MSVSSSRGTVLAGVLVLAMAAWTSLQALSHGREETAQAGSASPAAKAKGYVDFKKPSDEDLKKRLTPLQYQLSRGSAVRDFLVDRFTRR
jgi:hypothetical protein